MLSAHEQRLNDILDHIAGYFLNFESDCLLPLNNCAAIDDLVSNVDWILTYNSQEIRKISESE